MYTAADLIHVLQRRLQLIAPHLRRPPGEFPPGWQQWFAAMHARVGAVTGATSQALVDVLLQRPLAERPRRSRDLSRWEAFNTLWRQDWHPPEPEDRRVRWFAGIFTTLWHLLFGGMLLWLMYTRFLALEQEASKRRGEEVVQIEFIGRGTPEETGGGEETAREPREEAVASTAAQPPALAAGGAIPPAPELASPAIDAPVPAVEQRDIPEPQLPPTPAPQQNVEVSAPAPDTSDFVLSPPTPRVAQPQIAVPELGAPAPPLQAVEVPEPLQPIRRETTARPLQAPLIEARIPDVAQREVATPLPRATVPSVPTPSLAQPALRAPEATVRTREIPAPPAPAASTPASTPSPATSSQTSPAATVPTAPEAPPGTVRSATSTAGQGPQPMAAPGSFPTPLKSDDWGASSRDRPGGQRGEPRGLYDAEGGPRLTEEPVNTGQPPGTLDDRIVDLDRSGTWLKRKPTDYEPTTFDKYWRPDETLLAEWVRKGIKQMAIPIPGTTKKINCVVSLLALGGACGISDPNLSDQPATARPPPDVPFKPHLQEDNGSARPPGG